MSLNNSNNPAITYYKSAHASGSSFQYYSHDSGLGRANERHSSVSIDDESSATRTPQTATLTRQLQSLFSLCHIPQGDRKILLQYLTDEYDEK